MNLSYKKRIAYRFMLATAVIIAAVFVAVFFTVKQTVYKNLDKDLSYEAHKHTDEIKITKNDIHFINKAEWEEKEHREVEVNPVFIQIIDASGSLMDKSPNLKSDQLLFNEAYKAEFNSFLNHKSIRQIQIPITKDGILKGYIVAAMNLDASLKVLEKLKYTLLILFPLLMIVLFFISSYLAGKSISPVVSVINTTNKITKENLNQRVELPENKDVLFQLSTSINALLDRVETTLKREQQFTSDASHELRTPLSVLKGTLEVLVRKPRSQQEYEEKIQHSLTEVDRISEILDQLLIIARFDSNSQTSLDTPRSPLVKTIDHIILRKNTVLTSKNITLAFNHSECNSTTPTLSSNLIIENILDNAIKYSHQDSKITIDLTTENEVLICRITDFGIGIKAADLEKIFNPFYRSDALVHKEIKGNGLGLSIVDKAAKAINAKITVTSKIGKGTVFTIQF